MLPCRANKPKIGENPESVYLFAVSAVIAVVWVDSCPWRYGEQHFSRRYVRSGEHSPGCQLTSAAGEVRAWSPAARRRVVLLLRQDSPPSPPPTSPTCPSLLAPEILRGSFTRAFRGPHRRRALPQIHSLSRGISSKNHQTRRVSKN